MSSEVLPNSDRFDKAGRPQPDPTHVWVKLKLVKRTAKVNSVTPGVDPTSMLLLSRYIKARNDAPSK